MFNNPDILNGFMNFVGGLGKGRGNFPMFPQQNANGYVMGQNLMAKGMPFMGALSGNRSPAQQMALQAPQRPPMPYNAPRFMGPMASPQGQQMAGGGNWRQMMQSRFPMGLGG